MNGGTQLTALRAEDMGWFVRLPHKEKSYLRDYLIIFAELDKAESIKAGARRLAREYRMSAKTIMDKYRIYRQSDRDPRCLVRNWNNGKDSLPKPFVIFWQGLVGQNKRSDGTKGAYRRLIEEFWAAGEPVPGYGTWEDWYFKKHPFKRLPRFCPTSTVDLPEGWSYSNLLRYLPKKSIVTLQRQGYKAAHDQQKHLMRDRSKLRPMELVAIDDFWLDQMFFSTELGINEPFRAVGILARDVATGIVLGWFAKPRRKRQDGTREGINQAEVRELLYLIISGQGLPPYPVTFLVENASAAINQQTENLLSSHFPMRVRIERTSVYNDFLLKHGFPEKGGKPWEKSWVESYFRLLHTSAGHLPAQTGNRYDNAPGNLEGLVKYTEKLLKHPALAPEDYEKLHLPLLSFEEGQRIYGGIIDMLDNRTDHKMQGFDKMTLWRKEPGDPWQPVQSQALAQYRQEEIESFQFYTRLESSRERWQRLSPPAEQWTKVPATALWFLLPEQRETRIKNGIIRLHDKRVSHEPLEFWSENNRLLRENEGKKVIACYLPSDPRQVVLTSHDLMEHRIPLGVIPRDNAVDLTDQAAIDKAAGAIHRERLADIRTVRAICKDEDDRLRRDKEVNAAIVHLAKERKKAPQVSIARHEDALEDLSHHYPQLDTDDEDPLDQL